VLYGTAAALTAATAVSAGIPQYREWARMAVGPYAAGALVALAMRRRRSPSAKARAWLAVAVLAGAALVPMAVEASLRSRDGMGLHAQSEAIVTEEAAKALLDGRDPYATVYLRGPLAARPVVTKTHFPYLPGMVLFGVPRALDGRAPLADARVWFAAITLGIAAWSLLGRPGRSLDPSSRLLAFQVLAVLPTGALPMATGGDDLPVLALMLLSLVLLRDARTTGSGIALGAALALKQTALLLLPFLLVAVPPGRRAKAFGAAALVAVPASIAFAGWNLPAFVEDAVKFPVGLGSEHSAAGSTTLGSVLVRAFPGSETALSLLLATAVLVIAGLLIARRTPRDAAGAAGAAAVVAACALLLAPQARAGYLIYPIDLAVWAVALRSVDSVPNLPGAP
jgi:Glycosyltransferase family 87